jgi:RNA polymerase sigma factor (sigma-70 family)
VTPLLDGVRVGAGAGAPIAVVPPSKHSLAPPDSAGSHRASHSIACQRAAVQDEIGPADPTAGGTGGPVPRGSVRFNNPVGDRRRSTPVTEATEVGSSGGGHVEREIPEGIPHVVPGVGLTEETLLAGLASDDADTAAAFVRAFQGRVFGIAYAILGDREAATEVAQETFVRAWRHAEAFDPRRGSVAAWLLTIARNAAIDAARIRRPIPVDPVMFHSLRLVDDPRPDDDIVTRRDLDRLRRAVGALPDAQRRCLLLAVFNGMTAREISELDDVPLGTVKTRIRTALRRLRSSFEVRDD